MFDLFRSRQKTVRYLLGALLSLVAISMVVTLVPNYGDPSGGSDSSIIAEIGGEPLTVFEVQQVLAREMREKAIPPEIQSLYVPMLVQQMIAERAVAYQALEMGFRLNDQELAENIASLIPQLYEEGKFVGNDIYRAYLAQQNMTIPQFEANVRKQAAASRLEVLALEGVVVTPQEVEAQFKRENEKYRVSYFYLTPDRFRGQVTIPAADIQQRYEQTKDQFQVPEKRSLLVFPIEEAAIRSALTLAEDELRKAYAAEADRFRTPERVRARHILIDTRDKDEAGKAEAKKKAEDLLKQIRGGADFAKLAQEHSQDFGSATRGGDLDWIVRGQTVPEFEAASFSLKPGQVSEPVSTMFGYHIIRVEAREEPRLRPFDEVKDEIRAELLRSQVFDRMQTAADQIRAALTRSAEEAEKLALNYGIRPISVAPVRPSDPVPGVGADNNFADSVSNLPQGGVTPVLPVGGDRLVVAQVTGIVPPRPSTLEEVRGQIEAQLMNERAQSIYEDKIKETEERVRLATGDIAAVARAMNFDLKTVGPFNLGENLDDAIGPSVQISEALQKEPGQTTGPIRISSGAIFTKLLEVIPADLTQLAESRNAITYSIKQRRARERREIFSEGVLNDLIRRKKIKIYDENIQRLSERMTRS
jgi:peptidyl-prolyl cis-trans isomerase D